MGARQLRQKKDAILVVKHRGVVPLATGRRPPGSGGKVVSAYQRLCSLLNIGLNDPDQFYLAPSSQPVMEVLASCGDALILGCLRAFVSR